jgi:hypothetical protein
MALVKYNNNSLSAITSTSLTTGAMTLIKEQTASSDGTIDFVDGTSDVVLDSTYPIYLFKFINIHPETDDVYFQMNLSIDSGSNYNVTKTSTAFNVYKPEADSGGSIAYSTGNDLAQGTGVQYLTGSGLGGASDESVSGELWLFNPSSTTFVKHFISNVNYYYMGNETGNTHVAGYGNTTSAVDAVQFSMNSGDIDAGTFKLYGIKDS